MKVYYNKWDGTLITEEEAREYALDTVIHEEIYLETLKEMTYQEIWDMLSDEQQDAIIDNEIVMYLEDDNNFVSKEF